MEEDSLRKIIDSRNSYLASLEEQGIQQTEVTTSAVVPAYNEENRISSTLVDLLPFFYSRGKSFEIIVVDDGSSDKTSSVVRDLQQQFPEIYLITFSENRGKGSAVKEGILKSHGKEVIFLDADGATPIKEYEKLQTMLGQGYDVVIGSRAIPNSEVVIKTIWYRKILGRIFNKLVNSLILPGIYDTQCGFKLFTRDAAQQIFKRQSSERFSFDVEVLFIARKLNYKIAEVPVNWTNINGSKVNLLNDSIKMLKDIFLFRIKDLRGLYR